MFELFMLDCIDAFSYSEHKLVHCTRNINVKLGNFYVIPELYCPISFYFLYDRGQNNSILLEKGSSNYGLPLRDGIQGKPRLT